MVTKEDIQKVAEIARKLRSSFDEVLVGQERVKDVLTASFLCDANSKILLQGNVGAGKTTLANALRNTFSSERISVTSDLLPSDIQNQLKDKKEMRILEVDEFNRMNGKSQTAFIEVMGEHKMTFEGKKYSFGDFDVIGTQNPKDVAGTFTIPQAIYDRFDVCIDFDKLTQEEKRTILFSGFVPVEKVNITKEEVLFTTQAVSNFCFNEQDEEVLMRIINCIDAMHYNEQPLFDGDNIRAHKFLLKLAKLIAMRSGRNSILPSDVVGYIEYIYRHRIDQYYHTIDDFTIKDLFEKTQNDILQKKREFKMFTLGKGR